MNAYAAGATVLPSTANPITVNSYAAANALSLGAIYRELRAQHEQNLLHRTEGKEEEYEVRARLQYNDWVHCNCSLLLLFST